MRYSILVVFLIAVMGRAFSQDTIIPLWPENKIPNRISSEEKEEYRQGEDLLRIAKVQEPTIEVYLPAESNANGQAVLIFPGGGYHILAYDWEGTDIAKFLNGKGIAGIVVKYRLPSSVSQTDQHLVPLIDAQRALRMVRSKASEFNIDPDRIGAIGFSAGGHLVATLGTHYGKKVYDPLDEMDALSARPDFMALAYPYISQRSEKYTPPKDGVPLIYTYFKLEESVTPETPPTFLLHATNDPGVPVENSLVMYQALKNKGVSATMHIYPTGGHGFSLARDNVHLRGWLERWFEWMETLE
ncbi:alpha/beta hydrolase [Pareuzebyella sediminis]|uniref:alpha/beta hydrolase n=1 Tax=Pareuzebyella sediminis TaxID=2607998 RepID=UPI0011F01E93|nr:alpha/beta hydrolase [Pareuzebyella sediminis]